MPELIWSKDDDPMLVKAVLMRVCIHPPWVGQIREVYEVDDYSPIPSVGPGDEAYFLIVKADITRAQYDKIVPSKKLKVKLLQGEGGFLSDKSLNDYKKNKKRNLAESLTRYTKYGKKPKRDIKMDFANLQKAMICTAPKAWHTPVPKQEDLLTVPL